VLLWKEKGRAFGAEKDVDVFPVGSMAIYREKGGWR